MIPIMQDRCALRSVLFIRLSCFSSPGEDPGSGSGMDRIRKEGPSPCEKL